MKTIISTGIFIFSFTALYSQLWKQYADSAKYFYGQNETGQAIEYYSKAREELKKDSFWTFHNALNSYNLAGLYFDLGRYGKAEPLYLEARQIQEKILGKDHPNYARVCNNLALIYMNTGQYNKAESLYLNVKLIWEKLGGKQQADYAASCNNLGLLYMNMGLYAKAEPQYLEAMQIQETVSGKQNAHYATFCDNLASFYWRLGLYDKAEPLYVEAKHIREDVLGKRHPDYAHSCTNLASLYWNTGLYEKAEPLLLEAKQIFETISGKQHPNYAVSCDNLAFLYMVMGRYQKAERLYLEALQIQEKVIGKQHQDYALSLNNLALLYNNMGLYGKVEPLHLEAKDIREKVLGKQHPDYALSCNNLALLYHNMGLYGKAESLYLEAKEIREKVLGKQHPDYANSCVDLADLYVYLGQYEKAEPLYLEAKQIREKVLRKQHPDYANSCNSLALLYTTMGLYEKAEPLYVEARQIFERVFGKQHSNYAASCNNLAVLYTDMEFYEKAEPLFLEAKQIFEKVFGKNNPNYATSCNNVAGLYFAMGKYEKVELLYLEAKQIQGKVIGRKHTDYALTCVNLANLYWITHQTLEAEKNFKESFSANAFNLFSVFQFTNEKEKTNYIKNILGEDSKAYSFYISGKSIFEQPYSLSLFHRNLLLSASVALQKQLFSSGDTSIINKYNEWMDLKKYLSILYSRPAAERKEDVASIEQKADQLEKELNLLSSRFKKQQQQLTWKDIQHKLQADEASIEFASFRFYDGKRYTDSVYYVALVLKKNNPLPAMIYLSTEKQLTNLLSATGNKTTNDGVKKLYDSRGVKVENNNIVTSQSIYDLVWKPLQNELTGIKTIYFAPSGILHRIAFAALPVNSKEVLSDRYHLVQLATTASVTDQTASFISSSDNMQLFGGVNYDADSNVLKQSARFYAINTNKEERRSIPGDLTRSGSFSYLPGTEAEIETIRKEAKEAGNHISVLSGNKASEESFKALDGKASPSIIHIATHGFFFPDPKDDAKKNIRLGLETGGIVFRQSDNPLFRSGLLFAGANLAWQGKQVEGIEDGILTAYEVSNMYLPNTKLVVLSACETALGDIQGSEGVYGLQRAFKIAGVQNLVMSLWKVPDAETSEFMQSFYKSMFAKRSISDAFYQAQTIMKNKYRNDAYKWAAWVLVR